MQPSRETALGIFDKAMETEREGIKVYGEAAAKVQDVKAKEIFRLLAKAEYKHLSDIEKIKEDDRYVYSSYAWKGNFVSEISKEIEAIGRQHLPKPTAEIISASALDAINRGIKLEEDSIAFYSDASTKLTDPGAATLFGILLTTERVHLFLLELEKDIITGVKRT